VNRYEVGDAVVLTTLVKVDGQPTNATVALTVTDPDGQVTTPAVSTTGTGQYRATVVFSKLGEWRYRWTASGAATSVDSGSIFVRDPAIMLCDVSDVELALRLPLGYFTGDDREAVEAAIRGVSARVVGWTGQKILRRQHTATYWAGGEDAIELPQRPIVSIDSITLDGVALSAGLDYTLSGAVVRRAGWRNWGYFWTWAQAVIVYTAGFPYPPDDLSDLVAQHVAGRLDTPRGVRQYSIGSFSATIAAESLEGTGWSPSEEEVLARYRRKPRAGILRIGRP
jgi:YtkA-like